MGTERLIILAVVVVADLALAVSVLLRNRRSAAHRAFGAVTLAIVGWLVLDYLCDQPALLPHALILNRLTVASGLVMGSLLLYFTLVFPQREHRVSLAWKGFLAFGAGLALLSVLTGAMVARVEAASWGTNLVSGPLLPLMAAWAAAGTAAAVWVLVRKYRGADVVQRAQLKYLVLGMSLFAVVSLMLGLVLPMVTGSYELARLNALATLFMLGSIAYAMMRYRLMDIRFVVLRGAAYSVVVSVLAVAFVAVVAVLRTGFVQQTNVSTDVVFVVTALTAVLVFQPLRHGLERVTDGLFHRRTYDPGLVLSRIGKASACMLDSRALANMLSAELLTEMRLTAAAVIYWEHDRPEVVSAGFATPQRIAEGLTDLSAESDAIIFADELEAASGAGRLMNEHGIRVLVPLVVESELLALAALGSKQSGDMYTSQDADFLAILAPQAAISMKNARLFDEKSQRVRELTAMNELAFALSSSPDLEALLTGALQQVVSVTGAESGSILLLEKNERILTMAAAVGISEDIAAFTRIPVGQGIAGWVADHREAVVIIDGDDERFRGDLLREDVGSAICAPVMAKEQVVGVLSVNRPRGAEAFTSENMRVVTSFAGQLGIAVENARLYVNLENTFLGTISALAAAVDAKDPYTFGHSNDVTAHAVAIAEALDLKDSEIQMIRLAAALHDIGKIGIDGAILLKPGRLTEEERDIINRHPAIGADILAPLEFLKDAVPLVLFHHERYGGGGYPSGISGEAIPLGARIIAVADSFNAMVSDRPYREGLSLEAAIRELRENSGSQFDPAVAEIFIKLLSDGVTEWRSEVAVQVGADAQADAPVSG